MSEAKESSGVKAWQYALKRLAMKGYHSAELAAKMEEAGFSAEEVEGALTRCREAGYLNDAEWVARSAERLSARTKGPLAIRQALMAKGVEASEVEAVVEGLDEEELVEKIVQLLEKRWGVEGLVDFKVRQKAIAFLMRRGFTFDLIQRGFALIKNLSSK